VLIHEESQMISTDASAVSLPSYLALSKYSLGVGDRFAHQARAQLRACMMASEHGIEVIPVWNKSNREHKIVDSKPESVLAAANTAVRELHWKKPFHVDADHINLETVDGFLTSSDFFTLDVADAIGKPSEASAVGEFVSRHPELLRPVELAGLKAPLQLSHSQLAATASKYLFATSEAGRIYRHIEAAKPPGSFITEVSMDETDSPQTPAELLVILAALSDEGIPLQTVAPKFTGRFNKGVDYVGDVAQFETEFRSDLSVVAHAIRTYGLPPGLKLSIHSGSDKFSIYPAMRGALRDFSTGVHVKTAGTTWLEELVGLAEAGGAGLSLAKEIYAEAYSHRGELCAPYASVIDISVGKLPSPATVNTWTSEQYANALRHDQRCAEYNPDFRQLLHVGYKVAARLGRRYLDMLVACEESISRNVIANLYERHLKPIFLAENT
jgi:hypothetical protein